MKLCIVTHKVIQGDGQGKVNYEITREAIRRGYYITLLASVVDPDLAKHPLINWISIPVKGLPTELLRNLVFSWQTTSWLRQHSHEFDLVKVNGAITKFPGDVNAVHFVHSAWLQSPFHTSRTQRNLYSLYQWFYTALNAHWEKQAFRRAKVIVAVSEKIKQELLAIGVPKQHIRVILNGVDVEQFSPGETDRNSLGLPKEAALAAFVGDIRTNRKNLDTVLKALSEVPNLHLVVLGDTVGSPYPQLARQLDLDERVHFLGFRSDVAQILRAVDLFVFPSRYEACTLAILEAMASGLPVITASSTGGAEIVTPECGVVLPDSEDIESLAQALKTLVSNPEQRDMMGQAARTTAQKYKWTSMAANYLNLFEETNWQC